MFVNDYSTINIHRFPFAVIKFKVVNQLTRVHVRYQLSMLFHNLFVCVDLSLFIDSFKDVIQHWIVNSVGRPLNQLNRGF